MAKDADRTYRLEGMGYRVLRFWNNDVLKNTEAVLGVILEALAGATFHSRPSPRRGEGAQRDAVPPATPPEERAGVRGRHCNTLETDPELCE
ncbi:MAG TPA: DUF559 domain-containing protein [Dyella sp.]|uniref:DUF559 domain-containing protein n=1 Tax=Dyella sp. TaxID=1869338 RepID=UPI002D0A745E|nr:DUF559 domain-containing protein [Dyella sp.]HTV86757.1 DUF559 domain-containing protein [Dyella sp.]